MAGKIGELFVEITAKTTDLQNKLGKVNDQLDGLKTQADRTSGVMGNLWKQFAGGALVAGALQQAVGLVVGELKSIITEGAGAETAVSQLQAVLDSTKGATGLTKDELVKMANALQDVTTYSDETVMAAEAMLLRFDSISKDVFPAALTATTNVATALGTDLVSAAQQVGRALEDPINATRNLRSMNIILTEAQKDTIKSFMATGDQAGAQKFILDQLTTAYGNAAKAAGETFAGKLAILNNKYNELKEQIGLAILPLLTQFLDMIKPIVDDLVIWVEQNKNLITAGAQLITNLEGLALAFKILKEILEASWTVYDKTIGQLDKLGTIGKGVKDGLLLLPAVLDMLADKTKKAGEAFGFFGIATNTIKSSMEAAELATRNLHGGFTSLEDMAASLNVLLKSQLITEIDATEKAIKALKDSTEGTPGAIKALNDKLTKLKEYLYGVKEEAKGAKKAIDALGGSASVSASLLDKPLPKVRDLGDALTKFAPIVDEVAYATKKLADDTEAALTASQQEWLNFKQNVAQGIGDIVVECLRIPKGIDDALGKLPPLFEGIFKVIYKSFQAFISALIAKWVTDLLTNTIIKKTAEAATTAAGGLATLGGAVTTLAGTISTFLTTLATGLATALVTIATGIATAAGIIAAAAPEILIAGAVCAAVYGMFAGISALFGGGGGKNSDITYWLKPISERLQEIHDYLFIVLEGQHLGYMHDLMVDMDNCAWDIVYKCQDIKDILSNGFGAVVDAISKIKSYQGGGYVPQTQLAVVHKGEWVMPPEGMSRGGQAASIAGGPVSVRANIPAIDLNTGIKQIILEIIPKLSEQGILQFHVRGLKYV